MKILFLDEELTPSELEYTLMPDIDSINIYGAAVQNYNHLFYFYCIIKCGGVSSAARYLRTSQSSLSIQLKQLEGEIGKKLVFKKGRNLQLTEDGSAVYSYCCKAFEAFEELTELIKKSKTSKSLPKLRIGVGDDIDRSFVTRVISIYLDENPDLQIFMLSDKSEVIKKKLLARELDMAFLTSPEVTVDYPLVKQFNLPVSAVISKEHIRRYTKGSSLRKILSEMEIGLAIPTIEVKLRQEIDRFIVKEKLNGRVVFESNVVNSLADFAASGRAISLLPLPYVKDQIREGILKNLQTSSAFWSHRLYLVSHNSKLGKSLSAILLDNLK